MARGYFGGTFQVVLTTQGDLRRLRHGQVEGPTGAGLACGEARTPQTWITEHVERVSCPRCLAALGAAMEPR